MLIFRTFCLSASLAVVSLIPVTGYAETSPPLKRVSLSSAGVGYFEHEAQIEGATTLTLTIPRDQIDDVMKSLVVEGTGGGSLSVRMPGSESLSKSFRDFPFTPEALASPYRLLNELRGKEVSIEGPRQIKGRLMAAEQEIVALADGKATTTRYRVSVMTGDGLQQVILQDIQSLRFEDEKLREQMNRALEMVASAQENGPRLLDIVLPDQGKRTVRIGYVVSTPVWKVTYRVRLGKDDKARLQGWAVLENTSGRDWDNVALTLLSGNPVSFRQPLYQAYYTDRPVVPVETPNRLLPLVDKGEIAQQPAMAAAAPRPVPAAPLMKEKARMREISAAQWAADADTINLYGEDLATASGPEEEEPLATAEASENQSQIVLKLPQPQTIASGQSMMVPIIDQEIPAVRHTLLENNSPIIAVEIANNSTTGLPPGAITFYDEAGNAGFLGDGRIGALPVGEKRLVGFAADLNVRILRDPTTTTYQYSATIADNLVHIKNKERQTTTFRMKSAAPEKRIVTIDFPRNPKQTLIEPKEGSGNVTLIPNGYRIRHTLEAGKEDTLNIVTETTTQEALNFDTLQNLADMQRAGAVTWLTQDNALDDTTKKIFHDLADIRKTGIDAEEKIVTLQDERETIISEQERLRQNLSRVPNGSDLQKRYLKQMAQQEDRMEEILRQIEAEKENLAKSNTALRTYLTKMSR